MRGDRTDTWGADLAAAFTEREVARNYELRPHYPPALLTMLAGLTVDPGSVLDLGCGLGDLARGLAPLVDRVDAVDVSEPMIERGRALPEGDRPNLRWILGRTEEVPLHPPYGLATAGESLHWMRLDVIMPRIRDSLSPGAVLAIADRAWGTGAEEEREIWVRFGRIGAWHSRDLIAELSSSGLFRRIGTERFTAGWSPSIDGYMMATRSRASYPTDRERAAAFDGALRGLLERRADGQGRLHLAVTTELVWGAPGPPA